VTHRRSSHQSHRGASPPGMSRPKPSQTHSTPLDQSFPAVKTAKPRRLRASPITPSTTSRSC
jgi:hypothetical protein